MELQKLLYENYIKRRGKTLLEAQNQTEPRVGEVRLFLIDPPEWILITGQESEDLYTVVPLTTYVQLAITDKKPPVVSWKKFNLVPLPFWVYARREILKKYSKPVFRINDKGIVKIKEYVKNARTKGIGKWREKFIKAVYKRFEDLNLSSIAYTLMEEEEEREIVVQFPTLLARELTERQELRMAAQPQNYLRGKNWLGVVEGKNLILYLPEELIDKKIRITLKGKLVYEGKGEEKIIIENIPELPSYSFLEEEMDVQVLHD